VFYWVGYDGILYVLDVTMADTSSLKNRAWLFAFSTCPYIVNTFAGPAAADQFYTHSTWRWGFGTFAIIIPVVCTPLAVIFTINRRKAIQLGYVPKTRTGRTIKESIIHYAIEFDGKPYLFSSHSRSPS
jgi:MFS family permease